MRKKTFQACVIEKQSNSHMAYRAAAARPWAAPKREAVGMRAKYLIHCTSSSRGACFKRRDARSTLGSECRMRRNLE